MFNQITALGRLGSDPEIRYTPNGDPVTNFSLATDVGWGENKSTLWLRCNVWGKQAESANQYLAKGRTVLVVGELSQREYTANSGESRTSLELKVREMKFINDGQAAPAAQDTNGQYSAPVETVEELPW